MPSTALRGYDNLAGRLGSAPGRVAGTVGWVERPLRFGCVVREPAPSRQVWRERVRIIDRAGYDVLLLPDHLGMWPPFTPLVAAADASDRLRFGAQVLNIEFWNPALLAREAAAVDVLTDGRLELGFGAGHAEVEFRAAGLPYPSAGERVDHLAEAVPLVQRLLAGEEITADGFYRLDASATGVRPTQARVPVMVGGNGDRVLDVAARHADIAGLVGFTSGTGRRHTDLSHFGWDGLAERVAHVRSAAAERVDDIELSALVQAVIVTDDRNGTGEKAAREFEQPVEVVLASPFVMIGSTAELADHVRRLREAGVTYLSAFEAFSKDLARVMEHLR